MKVCARPVTQKGDDIRLGLGTALSSIKDCGGVLIGFVLISTSGKKLDLLEVFRPRRGACDEGSTSSLDGVWLKPSMWSV